MGAKSTENAHDVDKGCRTTKRKPEEGSHKNLAWIWASVVSKIRRDHRIKLRGIAKRPWPRCSPKSELCDGAFVPRQLRLQTAGPLRCAKRAEPAPTACVPKLRGMKPGWRDEAGRTQRTWSQPLISPARPPDCQPVAPAAGYPPTRPPPDRRPPLNGRAPVRPLCGSSAPATASLAPDSR